MYEFKSLNFYCQFKITDTNKTTTCLILLTIYFCGLLGTVLIKLNIIVETLPSVSLSVNVSTLIKKRITHILIFKEFLVIDLFIKFLQHKKGNCIFFQLKLLQLVHELFSVVKINIYWGYINSDAPQQVKKSRGCFFQFVIKISLIKSFQDISLRISCHK